MFPQPPTGRETSADVYRLLSLIHEQLENFENVRVGGLENSLQGLQARLDRIEAQLHRIEQKVSRP